MGKRVRLRSFGSLCVSAFVLARSQCERLKQNFGARSAAIPASASASEAPWWRLSFGLRWVRSASR